MVTSTSTPGSILMGVICLTISEGLCRSMSRLWILIWKWSLSLRTFTARSFSYIDSQSLGRHPNWSFHFEILFLCASDQVSTYLFQRFYVAAGESNSNSVNRHLRFHGSLPGVFKSHGCGVPSRPTCSLVRANSGESGAGAGRPNLRCSCDRVFLKESQGCV